MRFCTDAAGKLVSMYDGTDVHNLILELFREGAYNHMASGTFL